jgi:hypothetical protein
VEPNTEATPRISSWDYLCRTVLEVIAAQSPCAGDQLFTAVALRGLGALTAGYPGSLNALIRQCVSELEQRGLVKVQEEQFVITDAGRHFLQALEPTTEEILASIRRIISDDEASSAQQRATSTEYAEQVRAEDADDAAADTEMIDDIARVLSGGAKAASSNEDLDDILDPTEPGNPASEDVMMADEPVTVLEEVVLETEVYPETRPKLDFAAAFPPQDQSVPEAPPSYAEAPPSYAEEVSPSYVEPVPSYTEQPAVVVEVPASEPTVVQPAPSLDDPATALGRAIAALKAGDLAAFAREANSEYVCAEEVALSTLEPRPIGPEPEPSSEGSAVPLASKADSTSKPDVVAAVVRMRREPPTAPDFIDEPSQQIAWGGGGPGTTPPKLGWLVENIPRRMRTYVPVEAEIRVSPKATPRLTLGLVGQGQPVLHPLEVTTAMSLRLSAPKGGITIEAQCPETQWVQRNTLPTQPDFAAWRFTLTPQKRGSHILRLTFSYREIDFHGVVADSTLPDRVFDIVVTTNFTRVCAQAAAWTCTLVAGAALGAYFQPGVQFLTRLYH